MENQETESLSPEEKLRQSVLSHFFKDGKLVSLPSKKSKRDIILAKLAELFEQGREYSEPEVNAILSPVYSDYVLLRRELIEARLLTRSGMIYSKP